MKVLMIGSDRKLFEPGSDVRDRMIALGETLSKLNIVIFAKQSLDLRAEKLSDKVFIYPTNSVNKFGYIFDAIRFGQTLSQSELVTAQDPFECGWVAWRLAQKFESNLQLQIHTDFLNPYFSHESLLNKLRVRLAKFLLPRADQVRVVSQRIADSIRIAGIKLKQAPIIQPVFIDLEKIKNAPIKTDLHQKYPQFQKIILMASRLTREKNIGLAVMAMSEIVKTRPDTGLIVVGSGPEEMKLKNLVKRLNLEKTIIFESWTDDLSSYYKTADLFLLTSFYEGYGRTIVEAMAVRTPVIMSDVGLAGEILKNGQGGLIFPVNDSGALVGKIREVLTN